MSDAERECIVTPDEMAQKFHEAYIRLAPSFGYAIRPEYAKPWGEIPEDNRKLMIAVCAALLQAPAATPVCPVCKGTGRGQRKGHQTGVCCWPR